MSGRDAGSSWPFAGRAEELADIENSAVGAVLVGEAGIGKSRLLHDAVEHIAPKAGRTVR